MAEGAATGEVQNVVKRGILVEKIPYVTEDSGQIQDKLEMYFQGADAGRGEVERVICPLQGSLCKAIVIFRATEDLSRVISRGKHEFAGEPIDVSELPPEFVSISANIEPFYWDAMKKSESKAVADEITEIVGKANCERKPHVIKRIECSIDQLLEIENRILENGPLGSILNLNLENQTTKQSILERTVSISHIPYVTDDRPRLKEELQTYFKRVIKKEVQELVCGIKGDLKRALAIFPTGEDMNLFLSMREKGEDEAKFFDEKLTVTKVPLVISNVSAACNDFYFKLMSKAKQKILEAVMSERCGSGLTIKDNVLTGSLHQVCTARTIIMETLGLQQGEDSQRTTTENKFVTEDKHPAHAPSDRVKEFVEDEQFSASPEEGKLQEAALGSCTDLNLPFKDTISQAQDSVALKDAMNTNVKNKTGEGKTSNAISKYPGKAVQQSHEKRIETSEVSENSLGIDVNQQTTKQLSKDSTTGEYSLSNKTPNRDPRELNKSHTKERKHNESTAGISCRSNRYSLQDTHRDLDSTSKSHEENQIHRNSNQTQKQCAEFLDANENLNDGVEKRSSNQGTEYSSSASKAEYGTDEKSGNESNQWMSKLDIKTPPSIETEESLTLGAEKQEDTTTSQVGKWTKKRSADPVQGDSNLSFRQEKDKEDTKQTGVEVDMDGTLGDGVELAPYVPNNAEPEGNECAQVDKVKYEYVVKKYKDEFENIQTAHGVSISAKPRNVSKPNELIVEVMEVKKSSRRSKKHTQDDVLKAQKEFITLYSKIISGITTMSLECSGVTAKQLKRATEMLNKRFKSVLLVKESETLYIFCGEESTVTDGLSEFRISAGMANEDGNVEIPLAVDKVAFAYLKQNSKNELDAIQTKYNVYFKLQDNTSKTSDEQQLYVKPLKSGRQKHKVNAKEIQQAKDMFIALYQKTYFNIKRVQLTCKGVSKQVIEKAIKVSREKCPSVLIQKSEGDEYLFCGEEKALEHAVKQFRSTAGLLPANRKLRRMNSTEASNTTFEANPSNQQKKTEQEVVSGDLPSVFATKEGLQIIVLRGDITKQEVNIIVNAANDRLKHAGGVAKAISKAAGPELQKASDSLMRGRSTRLQISECVETKGYNLRCDLVIHTVGPAFNKEKDISTFSKLLKMTFLNVLLYADGKKSVKTIAIPLISSGNYGGPKENCTEALASALSDFSEIQGRTNLKQIFLVNIDKEATLAIQQALISKFPATREQQIRKAATPYNHNQTMHTVRKLRTREGLEVVVAQGDITICQVHAIVNAANGYLRHGRGVAAAIANAAGKELQEECRRLMSNRQPLQIGEVAETDAYRLPCKTVLHVVGPKFSECPNKEGFFSSLKQTFLNVLRHANMKVEAQTVALPLISSGVFGGCKQLCSKALCDAVKEFSENASPLVMKTLYLVNVDDEATKAIDEVFRNYFLGEIQSTKEKIGSKNGQLITSEGIQIFVEKCDITNISTDAIVNPTDSTLSNAGGVSTAIVKAAGSKFKSECVDKMKNRRHLQPTEVIYTTGGNLPCSFVLHVVSPFFNKSRPGSEYTGALQNTIIACLRMANNTLKLTSVSLPLIGSGRNAAPLDACATAMAQAIEVVSRSEKTLCLKQVTVVGADDNAILAVRQVFSHHFHGENLGKKVNVEKPLSDTATHTLTDTVATTTHLQTCNTIDPMCTFQTDEGIQVVIEKGTLIQHATDVLIVNTDSKWQHHDKIADDLYRAAGTELRKECDNKLRRLKAGDFITTGGHNLSCKNIIHFVEQKEIPTESTLLSVLLHANNTLQAKSAAIVLNGLTLQHSSESALAEALAKALKRLSRQALHGSLETMYVVSNDDVAISACEYMFTRHFKVLKPMATSASQALGETPITSSGRSVSLSQPLAGQMQHKLSRYQSDQVDQQSPNNAIATPANSKEVTLACQKCHTRDDVKSIESCGHTFCQTCIKTHIARTSSCFKCKALYCVAEEKSLNGTMTYYCRGDITLEASSSPGAILIIYEFPAGTQGINHPRPGGPYNGTRALAYLPNNAEGRAIVRQFRTAFIAGLTFDVKPNRKGGYEVAWSGLIPHKRNPNGGVWKDGYPDHRYIAKVKQTLDLELGQRNLKSY